MIRPGTGELLWDGGDAYDLYLVLEGGICLVDRRDDRVSFVVEAGDFVGELGMLMGQPAFLAGVAMADTTLLRVPIEDLHRLMATSTGLSDVLLTAFDARRRLLTRLGEGGLILAGDDDRDMHRLQEFAERNHVPYRTVLRSDPRMGRARRGLRAPGAGSAVVTGRAADPHPADDPGPGCRRRPRPLRTARPGAVRSARRRRRPGGLAAAVYGASEGLDVVVAENVALGGQAGTSSRIENYLGFPAGSRAASWPGRRCCRR